MTTYSNLPNYVERGGELVFEQPFYLGDAQLFGFLLKGTEDKLQALCDRYLNKPRLQTGQSLKDLDFRYRTDTDLVLLCFDSVEEVKSSNNQASFQEPAELLFWILTRVEKRVGNQFVFDRFVWFIPYIFLGDSAPAMATGREVYGIPKDWGWFNCSFGGKLLRLETLVFNKRKEKEAARREILKIQQLDTPWDLRDLLGLADEIREEIVEEGKSSVVERLRVFSQLSQDILNKTITMVCLKQFRHVTYGERACYQAIIEAPYTTSKFETIPSLLFQDYQVSIRDYYSHPMVTDLGLKGEKFAGEDGVEGIQQKPLLAFQLTFDFSLEKGKVIWKATEEQTPPQQQISPSIPNKSRKRHICPLLDFFFRR